ncbi:MAG: pseudouridine synthase [Bradymonadaceae bacterium]|nr:pseudouridine synthase [Lujinxingiaceae bacterium]
MTEEMRLQKFLSQGGVSSRRRAEQLMSEGRVKINGKVCKELGTKINPDKDRVEVDGKPVTVASSLIYLLVNKPPAYITSMHDPEGRPLVTDLLPKTMPRVWPIGRLDWDTEGLLIMTNDGKLTNLLTHPSHEVPKVYAVKVRGLLGERDPILEKLRDGVEIEPGETTQPAQVRWMRDNGRNSWLEMTITEGKNRQIRLMCEAVGHPVMKLRRIAMGSITIDGLPSGAFRTLSHVEIAELYGDLDAAMPDVAKPSKRERKRASDGAERKPKASIVRQPNRSKRSAESRAAVAKPTPPKAQPEAKKTAHVIIDEATGERVVRAKRGYRTSDSTVGDRRAKTTRPNKSDAPKADAHKADARKADSKRPYKSAKTTRPTEASEKPGDQKKRNYKSAKDTRPGASTDKTADKSTKDARPNTSEKASSDKSTKETRSYKPGYKPGDKPKPKATTTARPTTKPGDKPRPKRTTKTTKK